MTDSSASDSLLHFNGLNAATGGYLTPPLSPAALRDRVLRLSDRQLYGSLDHRKDLAVRADKAAAKFGLAAYVDPRDYGTTGWGMLFPAQADPRAVDAILEALDDLVKLRSGQAGPRYHVYRGADGYQPGDTGRTFAARHGVQPGSVHGDKMPYYLLIVADPQSVPFQFQYELDVQFAVGRIYFERLEDYACYARSVALCAKPGAVALPRRAAFFGVANGVQSAADLDEAVNRATIDPATRLSYNHLVQPLADFARTDSHLAGWQIDPIGWDGASKARLLNLLGGDPSPALLFSATHGLGWNYGDPVNLQVPFQGALVCQDWPGPGSGPLTRDMYLGAEDIPSGANILGSIACFFACFGAGTPYWDDYAIAQDESQRALAHRAFLSALPRRLLSLPRGGALAVIGHVERAWGYSFSWKGAPDATPDSFKDLLLTLMHGDPVGRAVDYLNDRYAEIATDLVQPLQDLRYDPNADPDKIAWLLTANNDARAYAVIGDPAACLPLAPAPANPAPGAQPTPAVAAGQRPVLADVAPRRGSLPVVLALASIEPAEAAVVQAEIAAEADLISFDAAPGSGPNSPGPQPAPQPGGEPAPAPVPGVLPGPGSNPPGGETPPARPVIRPGGEAAPAAPFSLPIDGLAFALQTYGGSGPVSYRLGPEGVSFNLIDDVKDKVAEVVADLNTALQNVAHKLADATNDLLTLEVTTCLVEDLDSFDPAHPPAGAVEVRFLTTISAGGDVKVYLPRRGGGVDEVLLGVHKEMVQQAANNRLELIKSVGELVASLFTPQK